MELIIVLLGIGLIIGACLTLSVSVIFAAIMFVVGGACIGYFIGIATMASAIFSRW